jgi:tetratricopeptide (TPR) repeat protein
VDAVLTGRVAEHGNELDVETELVNVATGAQLWGERYKRTMNDAALLQSAITTEVASQLRPRLSGTEQESLGKVGTRDPEAYQLYLKGIYRVENKWTPADLEAAREYFRQVISRDPNYAAAYAGLSLSYLNSAEFLSPKEWATKAREAAKRALELNESLVDAHMAMAYVDWFYDYDWGSADGEFKRAIELASGNGSFVIYNHSSDVLLDYGWGLTMAGYVEQGIEEGRRGLERQPLSFLANKLLGMNLYWGRRYDQAVKQFRTALDIEPNDWLSHSYLGLAYEQQGNFPGALEELQEASRLESEATFPLGGLGYLYARSGRRNEAEQVLKELTQRSERGYVNAYYLATVYAGLGRKEQALTFLEKAYADRCWMMVFMKHDPELDSLRSEPRFAELVRKVGLPQ